MMRDPRDVLMEKYESELRGAMADRDALILAIRQFIDYVDKAATDEGWWYTSRIVECVPERLRAEIERDDA